MGRLSNSEREAITEALQGLVLAHLKAGISNSTRVICRHCGHVKPLIGSARYDRYTLCNDCALKYELAKAEGRVRGIDDFVPQRSRVDSKK